MLDYKRIDISDGIDVDMSNKSKECMLYDYWYFLDKNFSFGPYLCDGRHNILQKCNKPKTIDIDQVKKSVNSIYFLHMSKHEATKLMANSNLIDKRGIIKKLFYI